MRYGQEPPSRSDMRVSVGIELEMVVKGYPGIQEALEHVRDVLRTVALYLRCEILVDHDLSPGRVITADERAKNFVISLGPTIVPSRGRRSIGVEASTPALRFGLWADVIPMMMSNLKSHARLAFNETTALHVHISIGRDYTVRDVKRIAKSVVLFEDQMDTHHPRRNDDTQCGCYFKSCSRNPAIDSMTLMEKIAVIEETPEDCIESLLLLINPDPELEPTWDRNYRYNFVSILKYGTIEFRQAAATLDYHWALDWIRRAMLMVTESVKSRDDYFTYWAENGIGDGEVYRAYGVPVPEELVTDESEAQESSEEEEGRSEEVDSSSGESEDVESDPEATTRLPPLLIRRPNECPTYRLSDI
jgi:hypothetical protein